MGVMSKNKATRLPERPKPPSWDDTVQDVTRAGDDDVVFSMGKESLAASATKSGGALDEEDEQVDAEAAQASYESALRLIESYERLSSVPSSLREQYSDLQGMGQSLSGSISQLRQLAKKVAAETRAQQNAGAAACGDGKQKPKQKKKK